MKKKLSKLTLALFIAGAGNLGSQTNNPAPYCPSTFNANYNMMHSINVMGTTFSLGPVGAAFTTPNSYTLYNNVVFPNLTPGIASTISINFYGVFDAEPIYFGLWIDYNNDTTFSNNELEMQNSNTINQALPTANQPNVTVTKTFTVPAGTSFGAKRMRVLRLDYTPNAFAPYSPTVVPIPCNMSSGANTYGCAYDFTVNIGAASPPAPAAQFSANVTNTFVNSTISFSDQSTNTPTLWKWTITPTTFSFMNSTTNTSQHPKVKFTAVGTYTVKLRAANLGGADSLTKTSYIKINKDVYVNEINEVDNDIQIFPNPVKDIITLNYNSKEVKHAEIQDNLGRTVLILHSTTANVSTLPKGVYFVKIVNTNKKVSYKKIIKE